MKCSENNIWVPIMKKQKKMNRATVATIPCEDSVDDDDRCMADRGHCHQFTIAGEKMDRVCSGTCGRNY